MSTERFIRIDITVSSNEDYLLSELFEGAEDATDEVIEEWLDENAWELLADNDWATMDVDTRIFDREVSSE